MRVGSIPRLRTVTYVVTLVILLGSLSAQYRAPKVYPTVFSTSERVTRIGWPFVGHMLLEIERPGNVASVGKGVPRYATADRFFSYQAFAIDALIALVLAAATAFTIEFWARRTNSLRQLNLQLMLLALALLPAAAFVFYTLDDSMNQWWRPSRFEDGLEYASPIPWVTPLLVFAIACSMFCLGWGAFQIVRAVGVYGRSLHRR